MGFFATAKEKVREWMLIPGSEDPYNELDYNTEGEYEEEFYEEPDPVHIHYSSTTRSDILRKPTTAARPAVRGTGSKVVDFYGAKDDKPMESVISHPNTIEEAYEICNHVRHGRMCIVDLTGLDPSNAQRIADYIGGVSHSLDGDIKRVNNGIFTVSPKNHRVTCDFREEAVYTDTAIFKKAV